MIINTFLTEAFIHVYDDSMSHQCRVSLHSRFHSAFSCLGHKRIENCVLIFSLALVVVEFLANMLCFTK